MKKYFIWMITYCLFSSISVVSNAQTAAYRVSWSNEIVLSYEDVDFPSLSPDGKNLAFTRYQKLTPDPGNGEIWASDSSGNNPKILLSRSDMIYDLRNPVWSPDGKKILLLRLVGHEMWVVNVSDISDRYNLAEKQNEKLNPVWWPDGSKVMYYGKGLSESDPAGLYNVSLADQSIKPFGTPIWEGLAAISPDAGTVAILHGRQQLIFVNPDGTLKETKTIKTLLTHGEEPIWSPNGKYIILGNLLYVLATGEEIPFLSDDVVRYRETGKPDLVGPKSISLSKDGSKIAFVMEDPNATTYRARIKIMDLIWQ